MTVRAVSNNPASPFYVAAAPNLTGQVGSLTTLLDAVLVSGFSGFTALGWTIGQTTTNKRQYVMAASGTGNSLWVDDTAAGTGGAKEARCSGYATMSATTPTGTGQFPTGAQSVIGTGMLVIRKSTTADATVRYWTIVGDGHTFYLWVETGDYSGPTVPFGFMFGDFFTYSLTDTSNCIIIGRQIENNAQAVQATGTLVYDGLPQLCLMNATGLSNTLNGHYVAANFTNVGGSLACGKHSDQTKMGCAAGGTGQSVGYQGTWNNSTTSNTFATQFVYPNGPDAGIYQAPIWIHHSGGVRGYLKGLWCPLQHIPLNHNDTFSGSGNLTGKSFLAQYALGVQFNGSSSVTGLFGEYFIETSDTWN